MNLPDLICEKCGENLSGRGLIANIEHMYSHNNKVVEYIAPTDNEVRDAFMEMGMPKMVYDAFKFAQPTEMERKIFEDNSRFK